MRMKTGGGGEGGGYTRDTARREYIIREGSFRLRYDGKFENFVALKFHRLVLAGAGRAEQSRAEQSRAEREREREGGREGGAAGIVAKEAGNAFAIYIPCALCHTYGVLLD